MNLPLIILCGIVFFIFLGKVFTQISIKSKCKNSTDGKLIGMDEYDKNNGGKNLTSDYKWRP